MLKDVNSDQQQGGLEADVNIDRATAKRLGLTISAIDNTLYDAFGQRQVSTIYNALNQYHVVMEVAPRYWQDPRDDARRLCLDLRRQSLGHADRPTRAPRITRQPTAATSDGGDASPPIRRAISPPTRWPPAAIPRLGRRGGLDLEGDDDSALGGRRSSRPGTRRSASIIRASSPAATISFNLAQGKAISDAQKAIEAAVRDIGMPSTRARRLRRHRARLAAGAVRAAAADRRGAAGGLSRARHSLRELHPSDHDHLDAAFGERRRADRAASCSTRNSRSSPSSASFC